MPSSCFPDSFAQVRLVDSQGEFTGIMTSNQARARAIEEGLDLVVIQDGDVPVCKIISYSKWKYQREKAKKDQQKKTRQNRQVRSQIFRQGRHERVAILLESWLEDALDSEL